MSTPIRPPDDHDMLVQIWEKLYGTAQPQVSEEQVRTLVPLDGGNWYYDHQRDIVMIDGRKFVPLLSAPATPAPKLAKFQPCGCVLCSCEDLYQCQGCGSKLCDAHKYDKVERRYVTEPAPAAPAPTELRPTYYVKHPDNTYSEADPQPYFDYEAMANNTFANGVPCYRLKRKEENNERRRRW